MRLDGRRILITGGASGIGKATAELFAGEGAALALLDMSDEGLKATAAGIEGAATVVADVRDGAQVDAAVAGAASALDDLDGVVNAAGIDLHRPFVDTEPADWQRVLDINLTGSYLVCRAAVPALTSAGGGTIVNIASGAGLRPLDGHSAYSVSKAGVVMLSKCMATELAAQRIRVNAVCPGPIDTPMLRGFLTDESALAAFADRSAMGRIGEASEIARAILFLTGDESSLVTGSALAVDGGRAFH